MTKAQIIEAYQNDLTLMAKENARLTDLLQKSEQEKLKYSLLNDRLRDENEKLRLQIINIVKSN